MKTKTIYQHPHLEGSSFYWAGNKIAVLCFHGFTATTVEVRTIAKYLNAKGYTTTGPLLPGHGTTPEDLNSKTWRDWTTTAESSYLELSRNFKTIFVLGESMGALLSLYLCAKFQDISGALLFAPAMQIPNIWLSRLIWPFKPYIFKKKIDESMLWQGYNVVPLKAISSLAHFQGLIRKRLSEITQPVIIFQGKKDATINPLGSIEVLERIGSTKKELVWLENSSHVILLDSQLQEVQDISFLFIKEVEAGKSNI